MLSAAPTNRFVGTVGTVAAPTNPYKSIYRGGLGTPAAPTNRFVGAATVPTAPTNHFSTKKIKFTIQIHGTYTCKVTQVHASADSPIHNDRKNQIPK